MMTRRALVLSTLFSVIIPPLFVVQANEPLMHSEPAFREIKPKNSTREKSRNAKLKPSIKRKAKKTSKSKTRKEIHELKARMSKLDKSLRQKRESQNKAFQNLRVLDTRIAKLAHSLDTTKQSISRLQKKIGPLSRQKKKLARSISKQRELLMQDVKLQYSMGKRGMMTAVLGQENHQSIQRAVLYHNIIVDAREKRINDIIKKVELLGKVKQSLESKRALLRKKLVVYKTEKQQFQKQQTEYRKTVASLKVDISQSESELTQLQRTHDELNQVLEFLNRTPKPVPRISEPPAERTKPSRQVQQVLPRLPRPRYSGRFYKLRGRLIWPVAGTLVKRFNPRRKSTDKYGRGVLLAAEFGSGVRAVAAGRVIYANWLRGYGFVLIIDHGNGYMTLYGHNRNLLKSVGDTVQVGEHIATVGESGGISQSALYFEIRRRGVPLNPARWCRKLRQARQ
jgi:septal ring factor EnvC (AmiA/AmiB activator)